MGDLLNEFLSHIVRGEGKKPPVKPQRNPNLPSDAKFEGEFGKWYSDQSLSPESYVGRLDKTGKWFPAKGKKKKRPARPTDRTKTASKRPTSTGVKADTVDILSGMTKLIKPKSDDLPATTEKKKVLARLIKAIQSGNRAAVQRLVDKHRITMGSSGRLKARGLDSGDFFGKSNKSLSDGMHKLMQRMGIVLYTKPSKAKPKGDQPEKVDSVRFTAQGVFKNDPVDQLDVQPTQSGMVVEGMDVRRVTTAQEKQAEERLIARARQRAAAGQGKEVDARFEKELRAYTQKRIRATNHNIDYILEITKNGTKKLPAYQFEGEEGKSLILQRLEETITEFVPDEEQRNNAITAIRAMSTARNLREHSAAWNKFSDAIKGTPIHTHRKYVAEIASALRVVARDGIALIPASPSFKLADVLALKRNPLTGEIDVDQLLVDFEEGREGTVAGSVKLGPGAGSGNKGKIIHSKFRDDTVDGVNCSDVVADLTYLNSAESRRLLFTPTSDGQPSEEAKNMLMGQIKKYGPMIRTYYGLETNPRSKDYMKDETLYEFLSFGLDLVCVDGKPQPTSEGMDGQPFKQGRRPTNGGQWRAWSVLGKITDAIHNRTVTEQYYYTERYNGEVTVADGLTVFSKMVAQHYKNMNDAGAPDQDLNAFTIPATERELRSGNPCEVDQPETGTD